MAQIHDLCDVVVHYSNSHANDHVVRPRSLKDTGRLREGGQWYSFHSDEASTRSHFSLQDVHVDNGI